MRISPPRPDFSLRVTLSNVSALAGRGVAVCVHALRKDGFDGDIELNLRGAPLGFALHGGRLPAGRDSVRITLTAARRSFDEPVPLHLEGRTQIGGQTVSHPVVPSDNTMQPFLWRHLVPSQELVVAVAGTGRFAPNVKLAGGVPVRISAGGTALVWLTFSNRGMLEALKLKLSAPPEGLTLKNVSVVPAGLMLVLKADADALHVGYADNLIVEAFLEVQPKGKDGKPANKKRRVPLGVLPAIPFEVVQG